jgi:glycosyltransferase involved in cell wall biosynthesis
MIKKILYVHPSNELYGSDRSLLRLVTKLNKDEFQAHVIVPNDLEYEGLLTQALQKETISFHEMNLGILRRRYRNLKGILFFGYHTLRSAVKMARYCRQNNVSLVHTNSTAVFSGGLAAKLARVPHVWHVREIITKPKWLNAFVSLALNYFATTVIAVSGPVKDNLVSAQPRLMKKIKVINNGMDPTPYQSVTKEETHAVRQSWGVQEDDVVIGMVGRISAWKGQDLLLKGATSLLRANSKVHLVFVGGTVPGEKWRKDALINDIESLNIQENVHIEDFRLDIPAILSGFDIFVLPSTQPDPFPGVVLEAMFSGKPVVATAHGGALEQVVPDKTGLHVSPIDPEELSNALKLLTNNAQKRQMLGAGGKKRALENYSLDTYVKNVTDCYHEIIERRVQG